MSIQDKIADIKAARDIIHNKLEELGLGDGTEKLGVCAEKIAGIVDRGTVAGTVQEGKQYKIEPGYYRGGSVAGVAGGGNYDKLEVVERTPTKVDQVITASGDYYALQQVTIKAIPAAYQNTANVTATADDVLSPKVIVDKNGVEHTGNIANYGMVFPTIDGINKTFVEIDAGYYSGGTVSLTNDIETALEAI